MIKRIFRGFYSGVGIVTKDGGGGGGREDKKDACVCARQIQWLLIDFGTCVFRMEAILLYVLLFGAFCH